MENRRISGGKHNSELVWEALGVEADFRSNAAADSKLNGMDGFN